MSYPVLARRDTALDDAETVALLRDRLGDGLRAEVAEYGELTVEITPAAWHAAVATCRDDDRLVFDLFDCLFGVDAGEDGLDVVAVLYSTSKGRRLLLRTRCDGGREAPVLATVTDLYPGANWHERETFDMFGIDFTGHPGLLPRILCIENFEGWPLRKEFPLASRVVKPWPGVKDPAEPDEDGNVVVREPAVGEAPGPSGLDELIAKQAREANPQAVDEVEADQGASGGAAASNAASEEPEREEVKLDQETYDRLIADGKSERIARSKAKAAFIKKQRAAEREAAEASAASADAETGSDDVTDDVADGDQAPASPDAAPGAGTAGRTADEAAPPAGAGDAAAVDADQSGADDQAADDQSGADDQVDDEPEIDADAAASASATADAARADQAAAREARAAEDAATASDDDADDVPPIPAGTPPPEDDEPADDTATAASETDQADESGATQPNPTDAGDTVDAEDVDTADTADADDTDEADAEDVDAADTADADGTDEADADADEAGATEPDAADGGDTADAEDADTADDSVTDTADRTEDAVDETDAPSPAADAPAGDDGTDHDRTDDVPSDDADEDEPVEDGPYGPGSAMPRADGSGPDGWSIKATTTGNVFHTPDSPNWRTAQADAWFADADAARAAGFEHWDPYVRTDLEAEDVDSTPEPEPDGVGGQHGGSNVESENPDPDDTGEEHDGDDASDDLPEGAGTDFVEPEADGEPGPVGGSLERDGGTPNPQRTDQEPVGYGALDTHDREPVADLPTDPADADDADGQADDTDAQADDAETDEEPES